MNEQERKKNNSNRGNIFTFQFEPPYCQSRLYIILPTVSATSEMVTEFTESALGEIHFYGVG